MTVHATTTPEPRSPSGGRYLDAILARKRVEIARRRRREAAFRELAARVPLDPERGARAVEALRRSSQAAPAIIAEVKFKSPSAGSIRPNPPGEASRIAAAYERGGAGAISVLADGPGFGGSPLTVRRVADSVRAPVLFKEFVLDPIQVELARLVGASMVLLLVCALGEEELNELVRAVRAAGMEPVVEAANERELEIALGTGATLVGVNARDLRTFTVDMDAAANCLASTPADRVAIFMSGVRSPEAFARVAETRADAVLIGEGLMRNGDPSEGVRAMREAVADGARVEP